jgi:hypothetical protein
VQIGGSDRTQELDLLNDPKEEKGKQAQAPDQTSLALLRTVLEHPERVFSSRESDWAESPESRDRERELEVAREWIRNGRARDVSELLPTFIRVLRDDSSWVKEALDFLLVHPSPIVRARSIDVLSPGLVEQDRVRIMGALADPESLVRLAALRALGRCPPTIGLAALAQFEPANDRESLTLAQALAQLGDPVRLGALLDSEELSRDLEFEAWRIAGENGIERARFFCEAMTRRPDAPLVARANAYLALMRSGFGDSLECTRSLFQELPAELASKVVRESEASASLPMTLLLHIAGGADRTLGMRAIERLATGADHLTPKPHIDELMKAWLTPRDADSRTLLRRIGVHPSVWLPADAQSVGTAKIVAWAGPAGNRSDQAGVIVTVIAQADGRRVLAVEHARKGTVAQPVELWLLAGEHTIGLPVPVGARAQDLKELSVKSY